MQNIIILLIIFEYMIGFRAIETKLDYLMCTDIAGSTTMGVAKVIGIVAIGCFVSVAGILGILSMTTMRHTQLCLRGLIKEMLKQEENKSEQTDAPDKK